MNSQQEFLINFPGILMWTILIRKNKEYIHYKKRKTFNIFHRDENSNIIYLLIKVKLVLLSNKLYRFHKK